MTTKARFNFTAGDGLSFQEANILMELGDALDYAVRVYEDVRLKRMAFFKQSFREMSPSGKLGYSQFHTFVLSIDPMRPAHEVRHMYRDMAVRSGSGDRIDLDSFCNVLQEQQLDRPVDVSLVAKGADPYRYAGFPKDAAGAGGKGGKKNKRGSVAIGEGSLNASNAGGALASADKGDTRTPTRIGMKDKRSSV